MSVGTAIKKARIEKHWKQQDLVSATHLSQQYLSDIERDRVDPRVSVVRRIAAALGVPVAQLLDEAPHGR